jgi:hypothetical protein
MCRLDNAKSASLVGTPLSSSGAGEFAEIRVGTPASSPPQSAEAALCRLQVLADCGEVEFVACAHGPVIAGGPEYVWDVQIASRPGRRCYPDHQFGIDRRTPDSAVIRCKLAPKQLDEAIGRAQEMIGGHLIRPTSTNNASCRTVESRRSALRSVETQTLLPNQRQCMAAANTASIVTVRNYLMSCRNVL